MRRLRPLVLAAFVGGVLAGAPKARAASPVLVVAAPGSRLADDLGRELRAAALEARMVPATVTAWPPEPAFFPAPESGGAVVVVAADDGRLMLVTRARGGFEVRAERSVNAADRMDRRRACLGLVEHLRALEAGAPVPATLPAPSPAPAEAAVDPAAAPTAAPAAVEATAPPPLGAPGTTPPPAPPGRRALGAATVLTLGSAPGEPTSHVAFLAHQELSPRWEAWGRVLWPLLGAQLQSRDTHVRMWTFGAAAGFQFLLGAPGARVRPHLGAAVGVRLILGDWTYLEGLQSHVTLTPAVAASGMGGLRWAVHRGVTLLAQLELSQSRALPGDPLSPIEAAVANARAGLASVGVLFVY